MIIASLGGRSRSLGFGSIAEEEINIFERFSGLSVKGRPTSCRWWGKEIIPEKRCRKPFTSLFFRAASGKVFRVESFGFSHPRYGNSGRVVYDVGGRLWLEPNLLFVMWWCTVFVTGKLLSSGNALCS